MSEPETPIPERTNEREDPAPDGTKTPFEQAPRDLPRSGKGCSRMTLAGCGLVVLVVGLGVLTMLLKASDLVAWSLKRIRVEVERTLPDDLPAVERERLDAAFDAATARIVGGDLDPVAFQALQAELLRFARRGRTPTVEEVRDLAQALESFARVEAPPPPAGAEPPTVVAVGAA